MDAYLNIDSAVNFIEKYSQDVTEEEISSDIRTNVLFPSQAMNGEPEQPQTTSDVKSFDTMSDTSTTVTFESCIKFFGSPILPPILSLKDREDMRRYKELAKANELKLRNKRRKKLIDKVTSVLNIIEERRTLKPLPIEDANEISDDDTSSSGATRTSSTVLSEDNEEIQNHLKEHLTSSDSGISSKMRTNESKSLASTEDTLCPELEGSALLANVSLHDETASTVCSDSADQQTSDSVKFAVLESIDGENDRESNCSTDTKTSYTLESPCLALQEQYEKGLVTENMDLELTHSFSEENRNKNESDSEITDCSDHLQEEKDNSKEEYVVPSLPLNEFEREGTSKMENFEIECNENTSSNAFNEEEHNNLKCLAEMYARADAKTSEVSLSDTSTDQPTCIEKATEMNNNSNKNEVNEIKITKDSLEVIDSNAINDLETSTPKKTFPNISDQSPCYRLQRRQWIDEESETRKQHLKRYLAELSRMPDPGENLIEKPSVKSLVDLLNAKVKDQDLINQRVNLRRLIDNHHEMISTLSKSEIRELENSLFEKMKERLLSMRDDFVTSTPIENTPERPNSKSQRVILSEEELHRRFCKFTAVIKGYLTRKLLYTEKVQSLLGTVKDTADFALHFEKDSTTKVPTAAEIMLQERVLSQLTTAMYSLHYLFIESSSEERMNTIRMDRERKISEKKKQSEKRVSTATLKRRSRIESQVKKNNKQLKPTAKTLKPTLCKSPEKLDKEALNRSKKAATMRVQRKLLLDEIEKECATLAQTKKKQPTSEKSAKKSMTRKTAITSKPMIRHTSNTKR